MFLSLAGICVIAAAALAAVNQFTMEPIAATKTAALQTAIQKVTPKFDNNPSDEQYKLPTAEGDSLTIYPARQNGRLVGAAVESFTKKGFGGTIKVIVGFDTDGKLVNYSVLQHTETPGLGSKMEEWFRTDKNKQSILGRSLAEGNLTVTKDGGNVDAITAATISSRAFLDAINRAYSVYNGVEGTTGASVQVEKNTAGSTTTGKGGKHE